MGERELHLLNMVYRNAEMGRDGLYFVLRKTDDTTFRKLIATQMMEYQSIMDEAEDKMREAGCTPEGNGTMDKMMVRMTACKKASQDNSPSALADMLIQGSSMGVTKIARQITHYKSHDASCLDLANRLQATEENNIHQLKQYL
jgi:hypothetical protein